MILCLLERTLDTLSMGLERVAAHMFKFKMVAIIAVHFVLSLTVVVTLDLARLVLLLIKSNVSLVTGFKEIVLTGVDLTSWGADLPTAPSLGNLVLRILKLVPDLKRLRLSSIDSIEADDSLLEAIANETRLMPHLHLSLQSGDNMILKRMKRRHLRDDAIKFCETVKKLRPEITFGADIIAGFPTETDKMFDNSLKLVKECNLTWLHVFPYSPRVGTPAARMPQVNKLTIKNRAAELRALGKNQVEKHLKSEIGKTHHILMETPHVGRTEQFTEVQLTIEQNPGQIVKKTIIGFEGSKLIA